jgi:LacI family transcriptional regulator
MKRLTMKQIAQELGVSRTTVSLVLQQKGDRHRISKETQERILAYARAEGFRPDYFASALNSRHSGVIGAVFPDVFESFMGSLIRGMESVLDGKGYSLMISTSRFDQERERECIDAMLYRGIDGLILVPTMPFVGATPYDPAQIARMVAQRFPLVLVDRSIKGLTVSCVLQDDYHLAYKAVDNLIVLGHSRIICLSFNLQASSIEDRLRGYQDAMRVRGLKERFLLLAQQNPDSEDLKDSLAELVVQDGPPDAFFVTTAVIADKLDYLLQHMDLQIPIVRFGSASPWSRHQHIIDIHQPHIAMGNQAASALMHLISHPADEWQPETIICR